MSFCREESLMRRRSILSLVGTLAVSGCQQIQPLPFEDIQPKKVVQASAETDPDVELSVNASIVQDMISPDQQARIELTVTWHGSEPVWFSELPAQRYRDFEPSTLWLLPSYRKTNRRNQKTWVVADDSTGFQGSERMVPYEPGEEAIQEYEIWANPYEATRIQPGQYEESDTACRRDGWCTFWDLNIEIAPVESE